MDLDKLKQWLEIAQRFHGKEFWSGVFDQDHAEQMMGGMPGWSSSPGEKAAPDKFPRYDIVKAGKEYIVLIDLPGVSKEEVQLSVSGNTLAVRGTIPAPYPNVTVLLSERRSGFFERVIPLPEPTKRANISARFVNGVLEIRFPCGMTSEEKIDIK